MVRGDVPGKGLNVVWSQCHQLFEAGLTVVSGVNPGEIFVLDEILSLCIAVHRRQSPAQKNTKFHLQLPHIGAL